MYLINICTYNIYINKYIYIYIFIYIYIYILVLTPTECSTFHGANVTGWRKTQSSGIQIILLCSKYNKNTH